MKTQIHILSLDNPIGMVKRGLLAMMLVLFTSMAISQTTTVVDIIANSPDNTTLEAAVIAAQLDGALAGEGTFKHFL